MTAHPPSLHCLRCGAGLAPPPLTSAHVQCPYCGNHQAAPPRPPSAWLAQHHDLIKPSVQQAESMHRVSRWMVRGYVVGMIALFAISLAVAAVNALR